jgi:hypothetical protein
MIVQTNQFKNDLATMAADEMKLADAEQHLYYELKALAADPLAFDVKRLAKVRDEFAMRRAAILQERLALCQAKDELLERWVSESRADLAEAEAARTVTREHLIATALADGKGPELSPDYAISPAAARIRWERLLLDLEPAWAEATKSVNDAQHECRRADSIHDRERESVAKVESECVAALTALLS